MKDAYSFHTSQEDFDVYFMRCYHENDSKMTRFAPLRHWLTDRRYEVMKKVKCATIVMIILSLAVLLQSCSLSGEDSSKASVGPGITLDTAQNVGYAEKDDVPTIPAIDQIPVPGTEQDIEDARRSEYGEKLNSFMEAANSINNEIGGSGYETFNAFSKVKVMFMDVLGTRGSILDLRSDTEKQIDKQTGFSVITSELLRVSETTYRIVELEHKNSGRMMGAFNLTCEKSPASAGGEMNRKLYSPVY